MSISCVFRWPLHVNHLFTANIWNKKWNCRDAWIVNTLQPCSIQMFIYNQSGPHYKWTISVNVQLNFYRLLKDLYLEHILSVIRKFIPTGVLYHSKAWNKTLLENDPLISSSKWNNVMIMWCSSKTWCPFTEI